MIYECLTGKPPFHSGDVCRQIETKEAPPLEQRRQELAHVGNPIPANWNRAVLACLSKKPEERPASIREFLQSLELDSAEPTPQRTSPAGSALIVGVVLALVILLVIGVIQMNRQPEPPTFSSDDATVAASTPPPPQSRFTNSLGMEFVSIPGLNVHFAVKPPSATLTSS
jgi:serine/threonine protein kinase